MKIYAIIRTSKMLDIDIMFAGSYDDCIDYLDELKNDKKYNLYDEYIHIIEPIKKYKIIIEEM